MPFRGVRRPSKCALGSGRATVTDPIVLGKGLPLMTRRSISRRPVLTLCSALTLGLVFASCAKAQESWDAVYLGGAHIGYVHTFVEKVQNKGHDYLRVRIDMKQTLKRGRDETDHEVDLRNDRDPARARFCGSIP